MKLNRVPMSLKTKIVGSNILNAMFIILVFTIISIIVEYKQVEEQIGNQALQLTMAVSSMPTVIAAFEEEEPSRTLQSLMENIRKQTGAEFIVIGDTNGIRYAHPDPEKIGLRMVGGDNTKALKGQFYISTAQGSLGKSIRGKGPIINVDGKIVGVVSVGYLMSDLKEEANQRWRKIGVISSIVVVIGTVASLLLARNIRNTSLGLEPHEITSLYLERNAILYSIKEGIISINKNGNITMINQSAKSLLNLKEDVVHQKIETILPDAQVYKVLKTGIPDRDHEITLSNKSIILNQTPIIENEQVIGVVSTFRDKTEINNMLETLSEVQRYSDDLRAQTHEFSNKLYVLSGLLQLGKYDEAIGMIQAESSAFEIQNKIIFEQINDSKIQALLLGKLGKASEKKIHFIIDDNCSIDVLPKHFSFSDVTSIIGNLIDNAFDAIEGKNDGKVTFFAIDVGEDLIIELYDNGHGIPEHETDDIFEAGYSTKGGENRGFGLSIVKQVVTNLKGTIEIQSKIGYGTVISIYLPKII